MACGALQAAYADEADSGIFVDNGGADSQAIYLSDIPYVNSQVGWGSLTLDKNGVNNGGLTLKLNGSTTTFKKGIFAHATSTVDYDVSEYNADYPYFVTYYGLNTTNNNVGNGVKFYVYTSSDGENWDLQTDAEPTPVKSNDGAHQFKINIQGVKYIRLYANDNGSNSSDHAVWADAKLVHENYKDNIVRTVEDMDAEIMSKYKGGPVPEDLQLLLLQRSLVNAVEQYGLRTFVEANPNNRDMLNWFLNDKDALRLWTMGGTPRGSYVNSLQMLSNLYAKHKDDLQDNAEFNGVRNGDLNLRMMLALSLTHASAVNLWIYNNQPSNAVTRYEIYKDMYANGKLENPSMFASLTVSEMRGVMMNQIDDEEILWLRDYTSKVSGGNQSGQRFNPYNYINYTLNYAYGSPQYYSEANYAKWDAKYNLSEYHLTYKAGNPKLWIVFEQGAVCGGLSKTAANIQGVWGYPASPVGQPGHCAFIYMYNAGGGKNAWQLSNSIVANGWANTSPGYVPYGWGASGSNVTNNGTIKSASYLFLSQEAQNEYEKFEQANMLMLMTRVYRADWDKLVQIYNDAYNEERINLDVWNGLINIALDSRTGSSQEDLYELAKQCAEDMKYHPLPMYDLTRRIGGKITDPAIKSQFMMLVQSTLENASRIKDSESIQAKEVRTVANALLGVVDNSLATFSFDGANENKLVLAKAFQGSGVAWEYSLDGGATWVMAYEDAIAFTPDQVKGINASNDIKVHIIGVPREGNVYTIDITQPALSTSGFSPNDDENRFYGTTSLTEYYISEDVNSTVVPVDATWTSFAVAPNLEGNKRLFVRNRATGTQLATNYVWYTFHENVVIDKRNFINSSHLQVFDHTANATTSDDKGNNVNNVINGSTTDFWRSTHGVIPAYITLKLDEPRCLSGLDFFPDANAKLGGMIPYGRPKAIVISVSADGDTWEDVCVETWGDTTNAHALDFPTTKPVQYLKFTCNSVHSGPRTLLACSEIKLYEDLTVDGAPRAKVRYDISSKTNHDVVAELVDISKPITVTNTENGAITHTFTDNGSFTFEFVDDDGNKGSTEARVDWIDKTAPQMDVSFSTTEAANADVVATLTFTEPVSITSKGISILNSDGQPYDGGLSSDSKFITFTDNDSVEIEFIDEVGNVGHKTVTVDWIDREEPTGTITYSTIDITEQPVVATVEPDKEGVSVVSEGGQTHTFDANGEFTFELVDAAGNRGTAIASVYWIKRTPKVEVNFLPDTRTPTKDPVEVTIDLPEDYRIMNNGGKNAYTFTESGEFVFQYLDPDGMQGSYAVTVDWIDNEAPKASITYDNPTVTNKDVTATLALEDMSEPIKVTSEGGYTHVFDDNGEFAFEFEDALGNAGSAVAKVDWIDRTPPTASLSYELDQETGKVIVKVVDPSEEITFAEGNGTYEYDANGDYEIVFFDKAGNEGRLIAHVDSITDPVEPDRPDPDVTKYPLTLDIGGGSWASGYVAPAEYDNTKAFALPDASVMEWPGHTFAGWFENADCSGNALYEIPSGHTGDVELHAKWIPVIYTITYVTNGGSWIDASHLPLNNYTVESMDIFLPVATDITQTGYDFMGWYLDRDFVEEAGTMIPSGSTGDRTFYAKWMQKQPVPPEPDEPGIDEPGIDDPDDPGTDDPGTDDPDNPGIDDSGADDPDDPGADEPGADGPGIDDPDNPGSNTSPDDKPDSYKPEAVILSVSFGARELKDIGWLKKKETHLYGRIIVPRSKIPATAQEIKVEVNDGIYVDSIAKQGRSVAQLLAAVSRAALNNESNSVLWDILLKRSGDPEYRKLYTLEMVPLDENSGDSETPKPLPPEDPSTPDDPSAPDDPSTPDDPSAPDDPDGPGDSNTSPDDPSIDQPSTNQPDNSGNSGNGASNENTSQNTNGNTSTNTNQSGSTNTNGNGNTSSNANTNGTDNSNANSNGNSNTNTNTNTSGNTNGNSNANGADNRVVNPTESSSGNQAGNVTANQQGNQAGDKDARLSETGDETPLFLLLAISVCCLICAGGYAIARKKMKK